MPAARAADRSVLCFNSRNCFCSYTANPARVTADLSHARSAPDMERDFTLSIGLIASVPLDYDGWRVDYRIAPVRTPKELRFNRTRTRHFHQWSSHSLRTRRAPPAPANRMVWFSVVDLIDRVWHRRDSLSGDEPHRNAADDLEVARQPPPRVRPLAMLSGSVWVVAPLAAIAVVPARRSEVVAECVQPPKRAANGENDAADEEREYAKCKQKFVHTTTLKSRPSPATSFTLTDPNPNDHRPVSTSASNHAFTRAVIDFSGPATAKT